MKVCIVGTSGKLGQFMVQHCLDSDHSSGIAQAPRVQFLIGAFVQERLVELK